MATEAMSEIGVAAGEVWRCLEAGGSLSAAKLEQLSGLSKNELQRAIGWLAREEKIAIVRKGRVETFSLT